MELAQATRIYNPGENEVRAMDQIDLTIHKGEYVALVGPSGSGKSTVLNCIGALDQPTSGDVRVGGQDTGHMTPTELSNLRNRHIGFIFQSFNLIPVMTAYENIEFALQLQGDIDPSEMDKKVMRMLKLLDISEQRHRRPSQLSGGQQQRVSIGRALVKQPTLVLADEPTANLDRKTSKDIISLMRSMNEELQATFIFSTHDEHLIEHARRVVRLVDGRVVSDELKT